MPKSSGKAKYKGRTRKPGFLLGEMKMGLRELRMTYLKEEKSEREGQKGSEWGR